MSIGIGTNTAPSYVASSYNRSSFSQNAVNIARMIGGRTKIETFHSLGVQFVVPLGLTDCWLQERNNFNRGGLSKPDFIRRLEIGI